MGMIDLSGEMPDLAANDYLMARDMAETLHAHYPNHLWAVTCEGAKGIATVRNLSISGEWGFVLHLLDSYSASEWKKQIITAGGELLERFNLRRGIANGEAIMGIKNDFSGRSMGDYSK